MGNIEYLEERLSEVNSQIQEYYAYLEENPDDATYEVALASLEDHRNELRDKLRHEKMRRENEIVEFRLQGSQARAGGIPLGTLGKLAGNLERQIYAAAYFIRDGKELKSRVPKALRQEVNLQLAGIEPGSTNLLVSGDLSPDLFGRSIFEDTLEKTFALLKADQPEELSDRAAEVGSMSARKLREFLDTVNKNNLSIDIKWTPPSDETIKWRAESYDLDRITTSLEQYKEEKDRKMTVKGRLRMMDSFGHFKIETEDGDIYECNYPTSLHDEMTNLHLEQKVSVELWRYIIKNSSTGYEKTSYRLQEILEAEDGE